MQLSQARVTTMLPVKDMDRARAFYEGKLGFRPDGGPRVDGRYQYVLADGATIALIPREGGTKAEHTALSFQVRDIRDGIRTLEQAGVVFEDYDLPGLKTVEHVCVLGSEKAAWFRDTEGNYLCLHEDTA
ncbi:VOC family protein [Ramlibacter sp. XY19]|uniref:VOC family protein n=1 Tax=Ramlibacter paludis TaxID=2908000 RepID=UPI0023DA6C1F|nr:VOC family protein [Ramlibacter paludis]MCG2593450.1 VOC family protein [Ramlibacter paludis]